jgi:hypothetical protein
MIAIVQRGTRLAIKLRCSAVSLQGQDDFGHIITGTSTAPDDGFNLWGHLIFSSARAKRRPKEETRSARIPLLEKQKKLFTHRRVLAHTAQPPRESVKILTKTSRKSISRTHRVAEWLMEKWFPVDHSRGLMIRWIALDTFRKLPAILALPFGSSLERPRKSEKNDRRLPVPFARIFIRP